MLLKTESNYLSKVKLSSRNLLFSSHSLKYSWDIFAHGTLFSLGFLLPQASLVIFCSMFEISPIYKYWEVSEFSPCCLVAKSCLIHCNPMNCKGSSVRGISQARILEWVIISFFRGSSRPKDWTHVSCLAGRFFTTEPPGKASDSFLGSRWSQCAQKVYSSIVLILTTAFREATASCPI